MAHFVKFKTFDGAGGTHELLVNSEKIIGMRLMRATDFASFFAWKSVQPQYLIILFTDGLPTTIGPVNFGRDDNHPFKHAHILSIISDESKTAKAERNYQAILDDDEDEYKAMLWEQWKHDHPAHDSDEFVESKHLFEEAYPELLKKLAEDTRADWEKTSLEEYANLVHRALIGHFARHEKLPDDDKVRLNS